MRWLVFLFIAFAGNDLVAQRLSPRSLQLSAPIINCTPVKDQYLSATCWSFSSNSFLETELLRKGKGKLDLSEMYIARFSMKRKIALHVQLKGKNYFTPGGQFHDVIWVIRHYGMVPEEAYPGKPDGQDRHNHAELDTLLTHFVKEQVDAGITGLDAKQNHYVDSLLDHYLGPVPEHFLYAGKNYTPRTFVTQYLDMHADDYVEITSYTHHPFYKSFVLEDKYNWTGDAYLNVPLEDFSHITDGALANGYTVGWDGDANDPLFDYYSGMAALSGDITADQQTRQTAFEDQSTLLDHMMHIVGQTKDKYGKKWYYVKNSWGDYSNDLGGFLFMREDYFRIRTVAIIVNKNAIPADIRKKLSL